MGEFTKRIESCFDRLWPITRSITGPGFRESLDILSDIIPTERLRFETGRKVFDWTVPREWNAHDAYFVDPYGRKRAKFKENNLHLVSYSTPFQGQMTLDELRPHLHSLPEQPSAIPYITSYYKDTWGFCLSHDELKNLPDGIYRVVVDTELYAGHVEVGEAVLPGTCNDEVVFSTYLCHPSMANDQLSGPLVVAYAYERIAAMPNRRLTYRFVIAPETIGAICYLSERGDHLKKHLVAGYLMACLGDKGKFVYKLSRRENTLADRAAKIALRDLGDYGVVGFDPSNGSDERQYCSPGFNLPFGGLSRTLYGLYSQYHTSLDNKDFIDFDALAGSVDATMAIVNALESNLVWRNTVQCCEPQLGPRGLYRSIGTRDRLTGSMEAMMWLLNLADGEHDVLAIAERSGVNLEALIHVAERVAQSGLIELVSSKSYDRNRWGSNHHQTKS